MNVLKPGLGLTMVYQLPDASADIREPIVLFEYEVLEAFSFQTKKGVQ